MPNVTLHHANEPPKSYPYHLLVINNYRLPPDADRCHLEVRPNLLNHKTDRLIPFSAEAPFQRRVPTAVSDESTGLLSTSGVEEKRSEEENQTFLNSPHVQTFVQPSISEGRLSCTPNCFSPQISQESRPLQSAHAGQLCNFTTHVSQFFIRAQSFV